MNENDHSLFRRASGFFTQQEAAELCGIHFKTLSYRLTRRMIPKPSRRFGRGRRRYYNREDIEELQKLFGTNSER